MWKNNVVHTKWNVRFIRIRSGKITNTKTTSIKYSRLIEWRFVDINVPENLQSYCYKYKLYWLQSVTKLSASQYKYVFKSLVVSYFVFFWTEWLLLLVMKARSRPRRASEFATLEAMAGPPSPSRPPPSWRSWAVGLAWAFTSWTGTYVLSG